MPRSKKDNRQTPTHRSRKAHMPRLPRKLALRLTPQQTEHRDVGQFTAEGNPGLEKK